MVPNPDPKQYWNKEWHVFVFCDQSKETWWAATTQLDKSDVDTLCEKNLFLEMRNFST